jgi:hypothetical protein
MGTKHHIVGHAGKLSKEQLAQIEADYERDLALSQTEAKPAKSASKSDPKDESTTKKGRDTGQ